jgi:hypothetical protein
VPNKFKAVINSIRSKARYYGIKIVLLREGTEKETDVFYGDRLIVEVNEDSIYDWIHQFLHESCHMDQDFGRTKVSKETRERWDAASKDLWDWLGGKKRLSKKRIDYVVETVIEMEKDCEMRTVQKIKDFKLDIDIPGYIRQANVHLYSYLIFKQKRAYIQKIGMGQLPYVSTKFKKSYKKVPAKLRSMLNKEAISLMNNQIAA